MRNAVSSLALVAVLAGCASRGAADVITYEITGNLKITNDCDGQLNSIPAKVEVWFELVNKSGSVGVYAHDTVTLRPDPASPGNPVKVGVYSAQARWAPSGGKAHQWRSPIVMVVGSPRLPTPTPIDLSPWYVCRGIQCPDGTGPCHNVAVNDPVAPADPPFPTAYDIEIVCSCN